MMMMAPASAVDFGKLRPASMAIRLENKMCSTVARASRTTPSMTSVKPKFRVLLTGMPGDIDSDARRYRKNLKMVNPKPIIARQVRT